MKKLVGNLNVRDYSEVNDMIYELLKERYSIECCGLDFLEKDVEYVTGTVNIVKLGDKPNTLKHQQYLNGECVWTDDVTITESYKYAEYYRLDKMNYLCKSVLSGKWSETYNFNRVLNGDAEILNYKTENTELIVCPNCGDNVDDSYDLFRNGKQK